MSPSEPPSSLALDDIMLIEDDDDDDGNNNSDLEKLSDIQDQLQKQAEIIRDLLVQRDYLITQTIQERERWQAEREGWDRTSEALVGRQARKEKDSDPLKEEELERRCAMYESDNKALKVKLNDTQSRLSGLEAELSKLKPLLVIQPPFASSNQLDPTRNPVPYPYAQMQRFMSPSITAVPYIPLSSYDSTSTPIASSKKRKRGGHLTDGGGKEKDVPHDQTPDGKGDGDTDTEAPPTPTPVPTSQNVYAYINDLYRQAVSPTKALIPSNPNTPNAAAFIASNPSSSRSLNYSVSWSQPYNILPFSKQPSLSTTVEAPSTHSRPEDDGKDDNPLDVVQELSSKPQSSSPSKSLPGTARRSGTAARRSQQQVRQRANTTLNDARAEHLLLAARKIGRERAAAVAGIVKTQDKQVFEESSKDKVKQRESTHSTTIASTKRTLQRSRATLIQSPGTPTPRRIHGPTERLFMSPPAHGSSHGLTTSASKPRDSLVSSTRSVRITPSTSDATTLTLNKDDKDAGPGQTPLDSLLSAARTMMSEDCQDDRNLEQSVSTLDGVPDADQNRRPSQSQVQSEGAEEVVLRKKRRRNTTTRSPATPKARTSERLRATASSSNSRHDRELGTTTSPLKYAPTVQTHGSTLSSQRTKSALDVLADQAAAACDSGPVTTVGGNQNDVGDQAGHDTPSSASYLGPRINEAIEPLRIPGIHSDEATQPEAASTEPRLRAADQVARSTDLGKGVSMNPRGEGSGGRHDTVNANSSPAGHSLEPYAKDLNSSTSLHSAAGCTSISQSSTEDLVAAPNETIAELAQLPLLVHPSGISASHPDRHASQQIGIMISSDLLNPDPFGSRPNPVTSIMETGAESEGDLDAEGDIDPDSQAQALGI